MKLGKPFIKENQFPFFPRTIIKVKYIFQIDLDERSAGFFSIDLSISENCEGY